MDDYFERTLFRPGLLGLIVAFVTLTAAAQDPDKPLALLRQPVGTKGYVIRVQTNAHLPAESKLSAILTNKSNLITWAEEVKDCPSDQVNQFCKDIEQGFV